MSAVSSGSPQGNAEVREPEASQEPGPSRQPASAPHRPGAGPGAAVAPGRAGRHRITPTRLTSAPTNGSSRSSTSAIWLTLVRSTGPGGASSPTISPPCRTGPARSRSSGFGAPRRLPRAPAQPRPRLRRQPRPPRRRPGAAAAAAPADQSGRRRPRRPRPAPPAPPAATPPPPAAALPSPARPHPRARCGGQQAARRRGPHRHQHDGQPGRAHRDQRPRGPGQAARRTTGSSSTTTCGAAGAARCRSRT